MRRLSTLLLALALSACMSPDGALFVPSPDDGKADITDRSEVVEHMNAPSGTFSGELIEDFQADAYIFDGAGNMRVNVTTSGAEVNLFLYAPQRLTWGYSGYGTDDVARSVDGWGLEAILEEHAQYYLVVASPDGQGRGAYEITFDFECPPAGCEDPALRTSPAPATYTWISESMTAPPCEGECDGETQLSATTTTFNYTHGSREYDFIVPVEFGEVLDALVEQSLPETRWTRIRTSTLEALRAEVTGTNLEPLAETFEALDAEGRVANVGHLAYEDADSCRTTHAFVVEYETELRFGSLGVLAFTVNGEGC